MARCITLKSKSRFLSDLIMSLTDTHNKVNFAKGTVRYCFC